MAGPDQHQPKDSLWESMTIVNLAVLAPSAGCLVSSGLLHHAALRLSKTVSLTSQRGLSETALQTRMMAYCSRARQVYLGCRWWHVIAGHPVDVLPSS